MEATLDNTPLLVKGFYFTSTLKWNSSEATKWTLSALSILGYPRAKSKSVAPSVHSYFGIVVILAVHE